MMRHAIPPSTLGVVKGAIGLIEHRGGVVNTPLLFAGLIVLTVLAIVLFGMVELVERLAIPWHVSQRSRA